MIEYAKTKGIKDSDTILELEIRLDEILYLQDAHNFSYQAFLVGIGSYPKLLLSYV